MKLSYKMKHNNLQISFLLIQGYWRLFKPGALSTKHNPQTIQRDEKSFSYVLPSYGHNL